LLNKIKHYENGNVDNYEVKYNELLEDYEKLKKR